MKKDKIIQQTRSWIEKTVIQLNLCPFARAVYEAGRIKYWVVKDSDFEAQYKEYLKLLLDFVSSDPQQWATAFIILPTGLQDFECYLDFVAECEQALDKAGLQGTVQIASFHPQYCFSGESEQDAANYSNRSPWPMLHLLREDDLEAAISQYKNPQNIPERNQEYLRKLGLANMKQRLTDVFNG